NNIYQASASFDELIIDAVETTPWPTTGSQQLLAYTTILGQQ
ncbi:19824_t:CDS:2, partial [Dentiscutata erythropus]